MFKKRVKKNWVNTDKQFLKEFFGGVLMRNLQLQRALEK